MPRVLAGVAFVVMGSGLAAACSSSSVPAGKDTGKLYGGEVDAGTGLCGTAACAPGQLCCEGNDGYCTPTCMATNACPLYSTPCNVADAGPPPDAGNCCPSGWDLYACTFPNGTPGQACHNPQLGCASSTTCGQGCDPVVSGACGGGPGLQWYTTCGYPVCQEPDGGLVDAGAGCPTIGSACTQAGQTCGTASQANCGVTLVCASQDPKAGPGGCPISSRKYKDGIQYISDAKLQELHDEALGIKLATYQYKPQVGDPDPTHLGFIIEDNLQTPAVDKTHNRVDMYGYVSMVVAGLQVQEKEIYELRKELKEARSDAAACRATRK